MKKIIPLISILLLSFSISKSFAQCPGCVVNMSCSIPGGGLCPDSLPAGTQGQPYDEDVTAYLPGTIDAAPFSGGLLGIVPLVSVHINAISGLPFGLNWTCDHPGNNFYPSTGDTIGCVKICGTPISAPGVYNIVVDVTAGVDAGSVLGIQYANTSFDFQMVLLASTSGNVAFNYSPSSACESGNFTFNPIITAALPQIVSYDWDFGGGNVYSGATPPSQLFSTPGEYPVTLVTTIQRLTLTSLNTTATNYWWCGDVEETTWPVIGCTAAPDLYFKFTHGASTYVSSSGTDNASQSWSGLNIPLSSTSVALSIWDEDVVSADDDGGTWTGSVTAPGVYGYNTTSPFGGGTSGAFTIGLTTDTVITVSDTIHVYPNPGVPALSASVSSFCPGDSAILTTTPGYSYEWYLNDTTLIATGTASTLTVYQGGSYSVIAFDPITGCSNNSASVVVTQNPAIPFGFTINHDIPNAWLESSLTGSYTYQWQMFTGTWWVNIPAPEGVLDHYTPPANGEYQLIITNGSGCSDTAYYNFNSIGIQQNIYAQLYLYPNPTTGNFTIDLTGVDANQMEVRLTNTMGQVVYNQIIGEVNGSLKYTVDISEFSAGVYVVDVILDGYNVRKKIIKE